MRYIGLELSSRTVKRLAKYPELKKVVGTFLHNPYNCSHLTDLTVYIRLLRIDEPEFFCWDDYYTEDFYSWGHNSRYANVLEPMLWSRLNKHICKILNYLSNSAIAEPVVC